MRYGTCCQRTYSGCPVIACLTTHQQPVQQMQCIEHSRVHTVCIKCSAMLSNWRRACLQPVMNAPIGMSAGALQL